MREAFVRALTKLAADDERVLLVNGDLGFGVLNDFIRRFPNQYVNAGIAEQNMTAIACGSAMTGARAYTYSIGNFPTLRCLEQLRNDVCYHHSDVTVVAVGGGFSYGQLGVSHFATEDLAIMRTLPGMTVVAPSDPWQAHDSRSSSMRVAVPLICGSTRARRDCRRARSCSAGRVKSAAGAMRSCSQPVGSSRRASRRPKRLRAKGSRSELWMSTRSSHSISMACSKQQEECGHVDHARGACRHGGLGQRRRRDLRRCRARP